MAAMPSSRGVADAGPRSSVRPCGDAAYVLAGHEVGAATGDHPTRIHMITKRDFA